MIGLITDSSEHGVAQEFFELFKTPWEFYQSHRIYDVVLNTTNKQFAGKAKLILVYGANSASHTAGAVPADCSLHSRILSYRGHRIPIYGDSVTFPGKESWFIQDEESEEPAAYLERRDEGVRVRIGYGLFGEVRRLLTVGQPAANAAMPALELHIALLRDLIVGCGIRLVEIPAVPEGYRFIACLTHDVDHPSIREHKWDHTSIGFFYRAIFGSWVRLFSGRISIRDLVSNWLAALKLPFVYLGVANDFWRDFVERYLQLENGLPSTFFLIPFRNYSGTHCDARASKLRAARYSAAELAETIESLKHAGCEIGLHGIDAWCDSAKGRAELEEICRLTGAGEIGVRMHWLFFDQDSPRTLETADAAYDSTVGYNETVGYRAGATQAYKPVGATCLLELPLHVMDTALFYPAYLGLSPQEAKKILDRIADHATEFGGCVTINWHDRSLSPERFWGDAYHQLIQDLKERGAWFATAGQAVSWFQKRRSATFETDCTEQDLSASVAANLQDSLPGLQFRIHHASTLDRTATFGSREYRDVTLQDRVETPVS